MLKFAQLQLDNEATLKAQELEFEKYYFIARVSGKVHLDLMGNYKKELIPL